MVEFETPFYSAKMPTKNSIGYDIYAYDSYFLYPRQRCVVSTNIHIKFPKGISGYLVPTNDDLEKYGIDILNGFDYIEDGFLRVIMMNHSDEKIYIDIHRHIARLVLISSPVYKSYFITFW